MRSEANKRTNAGAFAALTGIVALSVLAAGAEGQTEDMRLPVSLDADSTAYDGKSSRVVFRGLRLTQGQLGITADEGYASRMDFEDSTWHFEGNVVVDVNNGHMESDVADMEFTGYQLRKATIIGSPATFSMQRPGSDDTTYAEAGRLEYDFDEGVVEFSGDAMIIEGGNKISSSYLVYNIREQRINASSGSEGEGKVRITYTPGSLDELEGEEPETDDEPPAEAGDVPEEPGNAGE